jgi:hypothetical protein
MKSTLSIMGIKGHEQKKWDPETGEGVTDAKAAFDNAKEHMAMFEKGADGEHERIREFNPNAREIIAVPQLAGG